jgi:hypothetical protein
MLKMNKPTVIKQYTKQNCQQSARTQLTRNNLSCGTNPNPSNAHCLQKANTIYQKQMDKCNNY